MGALAIAPAAVAQQLIPRSEGVGLKDFLFNVFCRVAFTEEFSRFMFILLLLKIRDKGSCFGAIGLVVGFGFALAENAAYSVSGMQTALLRGFTAAPMHAACGARVGAAAYLIRESRLLGVRRFLSAVLLHGTYNMLAGGSGVMRVFSVLLALFAFLLAVREATNKGSSD
jgi:RsiW-degrading membrane proteinase PrsW (M82 family)